MVYKKYHCIIDKPSGGRMINFIMWGSRGIIIKNQNIYVYIILDDVDSILMYLLIVFVSINFLFGIDFEKHGEEKFAVKVILR